MNDDESGLHHDYEQWLEKVAPHDLVSQHQHNRTGKDTADARAKPHIIGRAVVVEIIGE